MKKYIKIMRIDHWIKQMFILPGCFFAYFFMKESFVVDIHLVIRLITGFLGTCFIASANYVINEWLDAKFDRFHPTKKNRSVVTNDMSVKVVIAMYIVLTLCGFVLGYFTSFPFLCMVIWLWVMGILYNVQPMRTKDIPILDVLSESVNNAIRLLMGWFLISSDTIPPCSIVLGYWMGGAFLMAMKRYAEYRMINNPEVAGKYRKSFKFYSEKSLLLSSFFYAMTSVFFTGVFLIKYRIELVLLIPALIGLFCLYFWISFKEDSAVQKPEKLYREKGLMLYVFLFIVLFIVLMTVNIPQLDNLMSNELIRIR